MSTKKCNRDVKAFVFLPVLVAVITVVATLIAGRF
jgi:hypothetical protein